MSYRERGEEGGGAPWAGLGHPRASETGSVQPVPLPECSTNEDGSVGRASCTVVAAAGTAKAEAGSESSDGEAEDGEEVQWTRGWESGSARDST